MPGTASFFRLLGFSIVIGGGLAAALAPRAARAGEADDLQVMIDRARNGVPDLERQDERGAARDEASVLRMWLDEAWRLRSEQKYDEVRIVLDRCDAQTAMIREKIAASKETAQANARDQTLKRLRESIEKTRRDILKAITDKAALEARAKS
jgi:hypothetical protein